MNRIVSISCFLLVFVFGYTGLVKLFDHEGTQEQMMQSPFINIFAKYLSWIIPVTELLIVGLLLLKRTLILGLYLSLLMMTIFTTYIYMMLNSPNYIPCSCGGIISLLTWRQHFWLNLLLLTISALSIIIATKRKDTKHSQLETSAFQATIL